MKLGTENRKQLIALVVVLAILIPAVYNFKHVMWGDNASAAPAVSPTAPPKPAGVLSGPDSSDPRLRTDILDASRKVKYEAGGRNIFTMEEIPKIESSVRAPLPPAGPPAPITPTPTPPPPPIPINYYGFASKPGEAKKVFLQQKGAEAIFVAAQGDIVARRYRLVQIAANSVTMEDVLTGNRQDIRLTPR